MKQSNEIDVGMPRLSAPSNLLRQLPCRSSGRRDRNHVRIRMKPLKHCMFVHDALHAADKNRSIKVGPRQHCFAHAQEARFAVTRNLVDLLDVAKP